MILALEDQIEVKKDWINPILTIILAFLTSIIGFMIVLIDLEYATSPIKFYPKAILIPSFYSDVILFLNLAFSFLLAGTGFFLWFGLGTQKCNIDTYGFGFGVPGAGILSVCSFLNFHFLGELKSFTISLLSLACVVIGVLLFIFRHKIDADVIYQIIPLNDKISELDLQKIRFPYGILRLQRAISRGIRAQYLNPLFFIDKNKLIRGEIKIIDKKYLYKNVHTSHLYGVVGYAMSFSSIIFLLLYFSNGIYYLITFFIVLSVGVSLIDYYYIRRLNLRKTILIIDHWLRRTGAVDLSIIDKEFGFLPIKYSLSELKKIAKRYEGFLQARLMGARLEKK